MNVEIARNYWTRRAMTAIPKLTRLPSGDLAATLAGEILRVVPNHYDRRRLRYWRVQKLTGAPLTVWASTPQIALALAAARLSTARNSVGAGHP